ncbi:MAG TPA: hypothetical protein VFL14_14805 [Xanthomonadales bacterium]|nr:hypothetical protein [Xanthomonadales bacterium]
MQQPTLQAAFVAAKRALRDGDSESVRRALQDALPHVREFIEAHVARIAGAAGHIPQGVTPQRVTILDDEEAALTLDLVDDEPSPYLLSDTSARAMLACRGPFEYVRHGSAIGSDAEFQAGARLERSAPALVDFACSLPGETLSCTSLRAAAPVPVLQVVLKHHRLWVWAFAADSLEARFLHPAEINLARAMVALTYLAQSPVPSAARTANDFLAHPSFELRWRALQLLGRIDPDAAQAWLREKAPRDPSTLIRNTARALVEAPQHA